MNLAWQVAQEEGLGVTGLQYLLKLCGEAAGSCEKSKQVNMAAREGCEL